MDDLSTWLLEQVAQDERAVQALMTKSSMDEFEMSHRAIHILILETSTPPMEAARFRLAECEAKRRIIAAVQRGIEGHPGPCVNVEGDDPRHYSEYDSCALHLNWSETCLNSYALRLLALPYADRPGYLEEWKPQ